MVSVPSAVEQKWLSGSGFPLRFDPEEKTGIIQVDNFPQLGKLAALRFLEWAQNNPGGVISLPTGKTPEHFIREVMGFLDNWRKKGVRKELEEGGVDPGRKPDMQSLHFVQIDDFYPISPEQHNSFYHYVNKFYIRGFGLDIQKALLINCNEIGLKPGQTLGEIWPDSTVDISLRYRKPANRLEGLQKELLDKIDQWCTEYEGRVRKLGGIGFFLGGIGPDGHIGFNISGSDLYSTTRLSPTNYETQAAAASDLGGIEVSKQRLVITIGLSTITYNPDCVAIIMAAGEAKAGIVASAIEHRPRNLYPATALQQLPNARFYLTRGAAKHLTRRNLEILDRSEKVDPVMVEKIVVDLSLRLRKNLHNLDEADFKEDPFTARLLARYPRPVSEITHQVRESLLGKVRRGTEAIFKTTFLHSEPHHDDIMLGYMPYVVRHVREATNHHHFATLTSGFTAVTNVYLLELLGKMTSWIETEAIARLYQSGYFNPADKTFRNRDVWQYLDGVAADSGTFRDEGRVRRLIRNIMTLYRLNNLDDVRKQGEVLIKYLGNQYPGKKDREDVQQLKGMCREWEADCLWGYLGWNSQNVHHLRLGFYKGEIFTEEPTIERDALPILKLLRAVRPDIISVALDPEASGPDTHYKVLQATSEALKLYEKESGRSDIRVLGYRNVWYRYHPCEADLFVPVSLNMFALQDSSFKKAFISQRDASFPSYEHDGPFSELAQRIQVEQYQMLKTCLGREFFYDHPSALIRATRGMVYLKEMNLDEFYQHSRALKASTEAS